MNQLADKETEAKAAASEAAAAGSRRFSPLTIALAALAVFAVVAAGVTGWLWYSASQDGRLAYAHTRDDVLRAGETEVVTWNSMDYHDVNKYLDRWQQASTGQLLDAFTKSRGDTAKQLTDGKSMATSRVLGSAVTEVDDHAGKAQLMASIEMTSTPDGGKPSVSRLRYDAELTRTDQGWKLSSLQQVPAGS